jgi:hypothetical protein
MEIRFSHAGTGVLDTLFIDIDDADGTPLRQLPWQSVDTASWDVFATVHIRLGALHGPKAITIRLDTAASVGIDLDRFILTPLNPPTHAALAHRASDLSCGNLAGSTAVPGTC